MFGENITNQEKNFHYCARCGRRLENEHYLRGHVPVCSKCRATEIERLKVK